MVISSNPKIYVIMYTLWFNFILGSNFIFFCFELIIIHDHYPKTKGNKI